MGGPSGSRVIIIRSHDGLAKAPIPESIRKQLSSEVDQAWEKDMVFLISPTAVDVIDWYEATGGDDPAANEAMTALSDQYATDTDEEKGDEPRGGGNQNKTKTISFSINANLSSSTNLGAGFSGSISTTGNLTGAGSIEVGYTVLRRWYVPYGARLRYVRAYGSMQAHSGGSVNGTISYTKAWQTEIAKPDLGGVWLWAGPLPIYIGVNMPTSVGLGLTATASGSLALQGADVTASGAFDYTCPVSGGCAGSASFSSSGIVPGSVSGGISARADVRLWAEAAFRAYVYYESVAYGQVGVRPTLIGDLWGYHGNNCGDANGDGVNETVDALTFDLDWQAFVTGRVSVLGSTQYANNDIWHSSRRHILFTDLLGSSALTPKLTGPSSVQANHATSYALSMRPCWPYSDAVSGSVGWGDGGTSSVSLPGSSTHTWSSPGTRTLSLTAVTDAHGRGLNKTTTRSVSVW